VKPIKTLNLRLTRLSKIFENVLPPNATVVSIHDIHKLKKQGASSIMYSFFLTYVSEGVEQRKEFILRIYREGFEKLGFKEFAVLKVLNEHDLPVPAVYYFEADERIIGKSFIIMEKIVGKSASYYLNDGEKGQIIVDKMAKNLVRIHKLDPNCVQNSNVLREQYEHRQRGLLKIRFFIKRYMSFLGFCSPRQRRFIVAVKRLEEVKPKKIHHTILHMDYEPDHVLVSNGRYIVVDWGEVSIGDPAFDVAWTYHKLRLGREMDKMDLGEHFVRRYEKYMGQRLVNLQFCKDMVALELASWSGLSPFHANAGKFRNYIKLVDLTFGNIFGRILGTKEMHRLQRLMTAHHNSIWSNIEYIQSYATKYLEKGRYNTN